MMDVFVDVIVPVHNASSTIEEAVCSAMNQTIPEHLKNSFEDKTVLVTVCCYDDGSKDESWSCLSKLQRKFMEDRPQNHERFRCNLLIAKSTDGIGRGAGYARNEAIRMGVKSKSSMNTDRVHFLCLLDSDDTMHEIRIAEQVHRLLAMDRKERENTILGCTFDRDPPGSTWHYSDWANALTNERIMLERFREVTILQPTWMLCYSRWHKLGGYLEAPHPNQEKTVSTMISEAPSNRLSLIHREHDSLESLRLAEDLRFFHEHLYDDGMCKVLRTETPLVTYRHSGTSQSFRTSRKLLLSLRVLAFERSVLDRDDTWQKLDGQFIIWGAGRDGKDFFKALTPASRKRVYCFVDVDEKKISEGYYFNRQLAARVPILHFSLISRDEVVREKLRRAWEDGGDQDEIRGKIHKGKPNAQRDVTQISKPCSNDGNDDTQPRKRRKMHSPKSTEIDLSKVPQLPVVVCVAMYRTNGALERNVKNVFRTEGKDLWHFS